MAYLTEEEFKKETNVKFQELLKKSVDLADTFNQGVARILNICMWHDFYIIDDGQPNKNKPAENIWIGNRKSGLKFFEIKLNLKTGKLTSKISRDADHMFRGMTMLDPSGKLTFFKPYSFVYQVLSEQSYN